MKELTREVVMERAQKIGHCVCHRTQPCPCEELQQHDICRCAGEGKEDEQPGSSET